MRTVEEKKDTELISSRLVLQVQFWRRQKMLKECWMLLESQEQEGRSWQRRLVRKVLNCSSRCSRSQRRRRADERTFDASHDVFKTGCSKLWSCLPEIKILHLFDRMIQKTFFFLSLPLKPKRSSTILLSLSFSRESSMSECVKKM